MFQNYNDASDLEEHFLHLKDFIFFAALIVLSGLDYLPTHRSNYAIYCFTTAYGVFSFLRAPQGWCNAPEILLPQGLLGDRNNNLKCRILQWIDDTLIFAASFEGHLTTLEKLVVGFKAKKARFNVSKCLLVREQVEFHGCVVNNNDFRFAKRFLTKY